MYNIASRAFDVFFSAIALIMLSPIALFVFFICLAFQGRPVFFVQNRIGLNCEPFLIYKFRSMSVRANCDDAPKVTAVGKWLRRTSLDELPQLVNVLLGDMSIVGPRPVPESLSSELSMDAWFFRHTHRPGLTGLSQIRSRGKPRRFRTKYKIDSLFLRKRSLCLYFFVIFSTFRVLYIRMSKNKSGESL